MRSEAGSSNGTFDHRYLVMFFSKLIESFGDTIAPINPFASQPKDEKTTPDPESTKRRRLDAQRKSEKQAEANGVFAKKQRVFYHNRSTNTKHDAYIVGVHFDDGPDKPYCECFLGSLDRGIAASSILIDFILAYSDTIRYKKQQEEIQDDGTTKANIVEVEKQTTPDRLGRVKWDEEKSWRLLQ